MIDSHAHLQADAFRRDLPAVLARAVETGIVRILVPGWDLASSRAAVSICSSDRAPEPLLFAASGIHPHAAGQTSEEDWSALAALAAGPSVTAIGETGLDYDRMFSPRDTQLGNLRRHVTLALDLGKPLILHCRSARGRCDAQDDLLRELDRAGFGRGSREAAFGTRPPAVLHSFSGPVDHARRALELGVAISFSGLVFRAGEGESGEAARLAPADRLLVETDSPYLSGPGAPRRNEPAWVGTAARWLADQRGATVMELDLVANYDRIFRSVGQAGSPRRP